MIILVCWTISISMTSIFFLKSMSLLLIIIFMSMMFSSIFFLKSMSFLSLMWLLVYVGGMMIIFIYVLFMDQIFLSTSSFKLSHLWKEKKWTFSYGLFLFFMNLKLTWLSLCKNLSYFTTYNQISTTLPQFVSLEMYNQISTTLPQFVYIMLFMISFSLMILLSLLKKNYLINSKISFL